MSQELQFVKKLLSSTRLRALYGGRERKRRASAMILPLRNSIKAQNNVKAVSIIFISCTCLANFFFNRIPRSVGQ